MILSIHHVQITIPKDTEAAARAFYCDLLGLPEIEKPDSLKNRGGFWVSIGNQAVHVGTEEGVDRARTKAHIAYQVTDLSYWRERLEAKGLHPESGIPIPGFDRFEFQDPFGNRVEMIQAHDDEALIQQQLGYYEARAQEYDESVSRSGRFADEAPPDAERHEWDKAIQNLRALEPVEHALDLACGTGLWTEQLLHIADRVTAIDGSQSMLDINREKNGDAHVHYEQANLFDWTPTQLYDLVFFGFWLSHVPPDHLPAFLDQVSQAVRPGGYVFIVDEPASGIHVSGPTEGITQQRTLHDGRRYTIVKVYYDPAEISAILTERGFEAVEFETGNYFFHLKARKQA
jgi:SAM-dependent methyltransferase/catechol 2,3-dioxygenase-like lactoylglutathione lyase family enzyme